jgi:hypothetical protein
MARSWRSGEGTEERCGGVPRACRSSEDMVRRSFKDAE